MIIAQMFGGLGNQMFQYALGSRLAHERGVELKLDRSKLDVEGARRYELHRLNVDAQFARPEEVAERRFIRVKGIRGLPAKIKQGLTPWKARRHLRERSFAFDPRVLRAGNDVYLEGYWQSPRYFDVAAERLRTELQVRGAPDAVNGQLLQAIRSQTSVCVHVRRGDYVSDPSAQAALGPRGMEYYQRALALIQQRIASPHLFVFSDEPGWVAEHFRPGLPYVCISHNTAQAQEDLRLMSNCRHFIIANSSFSWWAAWLSNSPDKVVVAPERWGNDEALNVSTRFPADWLMA